MNTENKILTGLLVVWGLICLAAVAVVVKHFARTAQKEPQTPSFYQTNAVTGERMMIIGTNERPKRPYQTNGSRFGPALKAERDRQATNSNEP